MQNLFGDSVFDEMILNQALNNRNIQFIEEFTRESVYKAIYLMERIETLDDEENIPMEKREPITITINSYGGTVYDCLAWVSIIERLIERGYDIRTHIQGVGMSCGFVIPLCGTHRTMNRYSTVMCHQISTGGYGTIQDLKEGQEESERLWKVFKQIIIKNTKITDEQLENMRTRKFDWYMDAETAFELGVIDEIV